MPSTPDAVDTILLIVIALYALGGWRRGLIGSLVGLIGVGVAAWLAYTYYRPAGEALQGLAPMPPGLAAPVSFLLILAVGSALIGWLVGLLLEPLRRLVFYVAPLRLLDAVGGLAIGVAMGGVAAAIVATLLALAPLPPIVRDAVDQSRLGAPMVARLADLTPAIEPVLAQAIEDTLPLVPHQTSEEPRADLNFPKDLALTADPEAEQRLVALVNDERRKQGLRELKWDERLAEAGRQHAEEMFRLSYFAHESPERGSPANRARDAGARFLLLGENLAYAPTTEVAHTGLMNSPGHRANILSPQFGRLGIGVVRGGIYGRMFAQEFAD